MDLSLSEAQLEVFAGWKRPFNSATDDIATGVHLMKAENELDLVQDLTPDCSVVASLCAWNARSVKKHSGSVRIA